jgi:hypothetical protein
MVIGYLLAGVGFPASTFTVLWVWRRRAMAAAGPARSHRQRGLPGTADLSSLSDASELAGSLVLMQATLTELGDRMKALDRQRDELDEQLAEQVLAALRLAEQASHFDLRFGAVLDADPDPAGTGGGEPAT